MIQIKIDNGSDSYDIDPNTGKPKKSKKKTPQYGDTSTDQATPVASSFSDAALSRRMARNDGY